MAHFTITKNICGTIYDLKKVFKRQWWTSKKETIFFAVTETLFCTWMTDI